MDDGGGASVESSFDARSVAETFDVSDVAHYAPRRTLVDVPNDDGPVVNSDLAAAFEHGADLESVGDLDVLWREGSAGGGVRTGRKAHLGGSNSDAAVGAGNGPNEGEVARLVLVDDGEGAVDLWRVAVDEGVDARRRADDTVRVSGRRV